MGDLIKDEYIGTYVVSSKNKIDLYRIHIFENSIRFDKKFYGAIKKNKSLEIEIDTLISRWLNKEINKSEIFYETVYALEKYKEAIAYCYFSNNELDETGRYIPILPLEYLGGELDVQLKSHFEYLKKNKKTKNKIRIKVTCKSWAYNKYP